MEEPSHVPALYYNINSTDTHVDMTKIAPYNNEDLNVEYNYDSYYNNEDYFKTLENCLQKYKEYSKEIRSKSVSDERNRPSLYCNTTHDSVSCWPPTKAGSLAELYCPKEYDGIKINPEGRATRYCFENGTWNEWANYTDCTPFHDHYTSEEDLLHQTIVRIIYYVGFTLSTVALIAALSIFLRFKTLRCLRNNIHCHLIVTFILKNIMWIVLNSVIPFLTQQSSQQSNSINQILCKIMVAAYNYLQVTNFFWMLVEGLYLLSIIVWVFAANKIRNWHCIIIGWGVPALIILVWCTVKAIKDDVACWLSAGTSNYDYIYIVPNLIALGVNTIVLVTVLFVLVSKMKATKYSGAARNLRLARSTIILVPLLGITYVIFITPFHNHPVAQRFFEYINSTLQSLQGLAIAVVYCFLNKEVRRTIKGNFSRWQDERSIATQYTRASVISRDWTSHRSTPAGRIRRDACSSTGSNCSPASSVKSNGSIGAVLNKNNIYLSNDIPDGKLYTTPVILETIAESPQSLEINNAICNTTVSLDYNEDNDVSDSVIMATWMNNDDDGDDKANDSLVQNEESTC